MSKSARFEFQPPSQSKPKPGQIKRQLQRDAMQHYQPKEYPLREIPPWKPMG
jgi:hypothetical protein